MSSPAFKKHQIIGGGRRLGGCYQCGSRDRERLVYAYLSEKTDYLKHSKQYRVLHLAPEPQLSRHLQLSGLAQYLCGDLFTPGYSYPKYVINLNVLDLPFKNNYFDLIICNHVLEHVTDDLSALKEIYRVLRPAGRAILQVPLSAKLTKSLENFSIIDPEKRLELFGQKDHVRIYGQDYPQRLKAAGFKLKRINLYKEFKHFGINRREDLFIGFK